jgi:hypothetical protein
MRGEARPMWRRRRRMMMMMMIEGRKLFRVGKKLSSTASV